MRLLDSESTTANLAVSAVPTRMIRSDGGLGRSFSVTGAPGVPPDIKAINFFVANDGGVYLAARSDSERAVYVAAFSGGLFTSKVKLDTNFFIPYQIAVFRSGEFLLSGLQGDHNRVPFTAVFAPSGKLLKKIYEPEDEDARKRAEAGEFNFRPDGMEYSNNFVTHGDAVISSDGNAYLLRAASPAVIYVISSKGDVIRTMRVDSSQSNLVAQSIRSASGKLAISFLGSHSNLGVLQEVDLQGNPSGIHSSDDRRMYPGLLGCYAAEGLTFLSKDDDQRLHLSRAEPK